MLNACSLHRVNKPPGKLKVSDQLDPRVGQGVQGIEGGLSKGFSDGLSKPQQAFLYLL
jgi:hypothetical protein